MEVDIKLIKRTQEKLGKLIKRPVLTEKLLSRPPFRFLHDICTSFIKTTGLMKGLFSVEELNADNVKDKEAKIAFLKKLFDYLTAAYGKPPAARISSIIAGKEPEKTNEMLIAIADLVTKKINNEECLAKLRQGETKASNNVVKDSKAHRKTEISIGHKDSLETEVKVSVKDHKKLDVESGPLMRTIPPEPQQESSAGKGDELINVQKEPTTEHKSQDKTPKESSNAVSALRANSRSSSRASKVQDEVSTPTVDSRDSPVQNRFSRPPSARGPRANTEATVVPRVVTEGQTGELGARLAPPRVQNVTDVTLEDSSKLMAANSSGVSNLIIRESQQDSEDDDDDEQAVEETIGLTSNTGFEPDTSNQTQAHGGLVTKMLQVKKEYETTVGGTRSSQVEKTSCQLDEVTRQREKAQITKEIERLCQSLQALSRSALPLGKLIDFVQEDLETMQQEYDRWTEEHKILRAKIREEESLTQSAIEPLRAELAELQKYGEEQKKAIATFKAKILANDERIQRLLST